jgi:ubiquinone/menaquinone biosynthesis C-methylase UbiE
MPVNERFLWAAELIAIQPDDSILEIGCGAGILTELLAHCIEEGKIVAIDQSEKMITIAEKRNKRHI